MDIKTNYPIRIGIPKLMNRVNKKSIAGNNAKNPSTIKNLIIATITQVKNFTIIGNLYIFLLNKLVILSFFLPYFYKMPFKYS